ncbi:MAG: FHA domain-containing protein [Myxococcota bacterium]|nr:FHA domain-containing protein [Myxococcota bacterium]
MAVLRETDSGRLITLHAEHLIGRSRRCDLRLDSPAVSSQHATLRWTGNTWVIRDLGSRNGTLLDGALLPAGAHPLKSGSVLTFGSDGCRWIVDSAAPPVPTAAPLGADAESVAGVEGLLVLPAPPESPELNIYKDAQDRWVAEGVDGTEVLVEDLQVVHAAGREWRLHLPGGNVGTEALEAKGPTLDSVRFRFDVTRDQENVQLTVDFGGDSWDLGNRAHHWMLMELARARAEDKDPDETEQGWLYVDELAKALRVSEGTLSVYIFRARQQLASCGIDGAQHLVERRKPTRQLRFGGTLVDIEQH